jgi:TRAP-type uncharacterized transport system substrate-binding protein
VTNDIQAALRPPAGRWALRHELLIGYPFFSPRAAEETIVRQLIGGIMERLLRQFLGCVLLVLVSSIVPGAHAQTSAALEGEESTRRNNWTVGLAGGPIEGAFIWYAADLATALNDGENLRILPVITSGAGDNIKDLIYLKGIDIALTNTDALDLVQRTTKIANLKNRIQYIAPLFITDLHVFVRPEIKTLQDLAGKKVGMHTPGGAASVTGPIVFERLGIPVTAVFVNDSIGYEKMKSGEFAAILHMVAKPNDLFKKIKSGDGFHFLSVPYSAKFEDLYLPSAITSEDYPHLIKSDEAFETLAVTTVLAVYNRQQTNERFRRISRFIEYFFNGLEKLYRPPFSPKWKEVNLAGKVPGWTRYSYANEMLGKRAASVAREAATAESTGEREALFKDFLEWSKDRQAPLNQEAYFREFLDWRKQRQAR